MKKNPYRLDATLIFDRRSTFYAFHLSNLFTSVAAPCISVLNVRVLSDFHLDRKFTISFFYKESVYSQLHGFQLKNSLYKPALITFISDLKGSEPLRIKEQMNIAHSLQIETQRIVALSLLGVTTS